MFAGVPGCANVTPSLFTMLPWPAPSWFIVKIPGCAAATTSDCGTEDVLPRCVTVGVTAPFTTAVNVEDLPASRFPFCTAKAVTNMVTVPGFTGFHVPCQIPLPMCVICAESLLEKLAVTLASCPPGPTRLPHASDICTSIVVPCPTTALNVV